jgi:hypothetical protein
MNIEFIFDEIKKVGWVQWCIDNNIPISHHANSIYFSQVSLHTDETRNSNDNYNGISCYMDKIYEILNIKYDLLISVRKYISGYMILNFGTKTEDVKRYNNNNNSNNNHIEEYEREVNILIDKQDIEEINGYIQTYINKFSDKHKCFSLIWIQNKQIKNISDFVCVNIQEFNENELILVWTKSIKLKNVDEENYLNDINKQILKQYNYANIPIIISSNKSKPIKSNFFDFLICLPQFNFQNHKYIYVEK